MNRSQSVASLVRILVTDFFGIMAGSSFSACYLGAALHQRGHSVWLAYKRGTFLENLLTDFPTLNGVPFERTPKLSLSAPAHLNQLVRSNNIDVILCQASPDRYISLLARWVYRMPGVLIHTRRQKPLVLGGRLKSRIFSRGTDQVIAVSEAVKRYLVEAGTPNEHVTVIRNGIPDWKCAAPALDLVRLWSDRYKINPGDVVIGCVARIKKQDQILEAVSRLEFPTKVLFVGIDNGHEELQELASAMPAHHEVIFTGEISNSAVLAHYPLMSMMVLPSDMEGLSQAILEAMVQGVPVIATNASGNPEVIDHGRTGLLFEDGDLAGLRDLIIRLKEKPQLRTKLVEEAKKRAHKEFNMSVVVDQYEKLFNQLAS